MKYKQTIILILITILTITVAQAMPETEINRVTNQIRPQIQQQEPTFTNIETTVYHTVSSEDTTQWTTGASQQYDVSTRLGWCVIPQSQRGFYEDVKCQGSGVHEDRVYQFNTIEQTPQDSIPIEPQYTRGRTAKSINPQPKWTVAVNNQPGTPCYIPYGTLMYIDFGPGNPWNGIYRAEDTGAAFKGQCKIDVYAGVGLQASQEAEQHVSGKTPDIYILAPATPVAPPSLSPTKLADEYKFVTQEEYVSKHGSETITTRYIPELDKDLTQVGELILPYSSLNRIKGIKNFYDEIKKFSNEVLQKCENEPHLQKTACAHEIAKKYEEKITITNCLENTHPPIRQKNIQPNTQINISGIIKNKQQNEKITIELAQPRGETINITAELKFELKNMPNLENEYIKLTNVNVTQNTQNKINITIQNQNQIRLPMTTNEELKTKQNIQNIALQASDCKETPQDCKCTINTQTQEKEIKLLKNTITTQNQETKTNIFFYPQDTTITHRITAKTTPLVLTSPLIDPTLFDETITIKNTEQTTFKKETNTNRLIKIENNNEPDLEKCFPEKKHAIFCAKPNIEGTTYFQKTYYLQMNFSLKI